MAINLEVFRKSLIYDVTAPKQVIDNELNEIKNINQVIGERQASLIKIGWKYIKILFALVFVSLIMIFIFPVVTILIWLIIPIVFAIALFNYIQSWRQGRFSIQAYRYELPQKILEILSRDMDKNAQISLKLDFSHPTHNNKIVAKIPHPQRSGWELKKFQDSWLQASGQLLDKTEFKLTIVEVNHIISGWKRSPRGKFKYKSKTKGKGVDINLKLKYSYRKYAGIKLLQNEVQTAIQLPDLAVLNGIKINDKNLDLSVTASPRIAANSAELYQVITMMFLSCYQILNLARTISKTAEV
jgi:hypothetical protein